MNKAQEMSSLKTFWEEKSWWCQPWSILVTGALLIFGSWSLFHSLWFTAIFLIGVFGWWTLFLLIAPSLYREHLENNLENDL